MIYLVRHGETTANQEGLYAGNHEYGIIQSGLDQAARVGNGLLVLLTKQPERTLIVSSPLSRAQKTAQIIANTLGTKIEIHTDSRIIEVGYGLLEGQPIRPNCSYFDSALSPDNPFDVEPIEAATARLTDFMEEYDGIDIVAVGHGTAWKLARSIYCGDELSDHNRQHHLEVITLAAGAEHILDFRDSGTA